MAVSKRSRRVFQDVLEMRNVEGYTVEFDETACNWVNVQFWGLRESAYEGGKFMVNMEIPNDFPFSAPTVKFVTDVFHPNVASNGRVCMSLLSGWQPATRLFHLADGCRRLLNEGNSTSPLNADAAHMLDFHPNLYVQTAQYWTYFFANGPTRPSDLHVQVQEALANSALPNEERALKVLTRNMWNVE